MMKKLVLTAAVAAGLAAMSVSAVAGEGSFKVGVVKFVDHASLNQIEENIEKELEAKRFDFTSLPPQAPYTT